ncbi:MAG: 2-aminoethylphosphonate--pyruvate transaminase [Planctomycetota bacterium]
MSKESPRLFTPGPLTTSPSVRQAMMHDLGSRDSRFLKIVADIRDRLLMIAGVSQEQGYEAVLMQGSGTFGIESVIGSVIGPEDQLLIVVNGAYGRRMHKIATAKLLDCEMIEFDDCEVPDVGAVNERLSQERFTHLAVVHCETTTGIMNPIREIGEVAKSHGLIYIVDAMSSFGAVPVDMAEDRIDFLVSSANKCIQGVPGFSFAIGDRNVLAECKHQSTSVSLDLREQLAGLESNGQFRFTPPTHTMLAFDQALKELVEEGGVAGRAKRYQENQHAIVSGMRELGFVETICAEHQSYIITSFNYPADENFDFQQFYSKLAARGLVIYPGKQSDTECFRIGNIGHLFKQDMIELLAAIRDVLGELGIQRSGHDVESKG